jgi:hypothetical protein
VPPGANHVRLELNDADRDDLQVMAAEARMSMAAMARAVLAREIAAWRDTRKGKGAE